MKQDPTLFEPKSMLCDFDFGDILSAGISLFAGSQAAGAAEDASGAMVRAAEIAAGESRNALAFTKEAYNVGRADLAPYRASGGAALQTMNSMFIPGGQQVVRLQGQLNDLRAQRARLQSGSGGAGGAGGGGGFSQDQTGVLRQIWDQARTEGGGSREDRSESGFDPNMGAGTFDGTFEEWAMLIGGMLTSPVKTVAGIIGGYADYDRGGGGGTASAEQEEAFQGAAMGQYERDYGGDGGGGGTLGDIGGSRVDDSGPSGARDDIGTRDDGGGGSDRDGGGFGKGDDPGGGAAGSPFHKGGPVTDHNPKTYRNNMRITAQEGEVVMSRPAVKMLGKNFLIRANKAAAEKKGSK